MKKVLLVLVCVCLGAISCPTANAVTSTRPWLNRIKHDEVVRADNQADYWHEISNQMNDTAPASAMRKHKRIVYREDYNIYYDKLQIKDIRR